MAHLVFKNGSLAQLLARSAENLANLVQFFTFCTLPGTTSEKTISSLAHTEISQNGTLAVLAYAYRHQWEYPPPQGVQHAGVFILGCFLTLGFELRFSQKCFGSCYIQQTIYFQYFL